ncbi:hypothetical protein D3C78_375390 [compost metagenome]
MTHALASRSGDARDVGDHRLGDVGLDVGRGLFLGAAADLADHHYGFGLGIVLEHLQDVDEVGARDGVTTDTDAGGLAEALVRGLLDRFVGQGAGAGDDAHLARLVDVARHDADLALTRSDDTRAVRPNHAHAGFLQLHLDLQHVQGRDAFGDGDDELDASVDGFQDGVLAERGRHIDDGGGGAGGFHGVTNGVEHRQAEVSGAALARGHAADHLGTVGNRLFGVEGTLTAGEALADHLGVFVDQNAHYLASAALTTC